MKMKKISAIIAAASISFSLLAGSSVSAADDTLSIAYQYGLAYAPVMIAMEEGLIEQAYEEATGKTLEITWAQMSSGADINTGIASGTLDAGFMGIGPALTGISKHVGYKIFTNLSNQEHGLMTNQEEITSLGDLIDSNYQIALVNVGSIQHILLAYALSLNGYDPHALDSNIVAMKHPDGMTALQSGSVAAHLTSSPYLFYEREDETLHELTEVTDCWSVDKSFILGIASEDLHDNKKEVYDALCKGIADAMELIQSDIEAAAAITAPLNNNALEDEIKYMQAGAYTAETAGVLDIAKFMYEAQFLEAELSSYEDIAFENVSGN